MVYFSKKPLWVEHMPSLNRVNPKVFTSHTILVFLLDNFLLYNFFEKQEVNDRLGIEEVGVDLELCVHDHGHDVDLIMEASLKLITPLI